MPLLSKAAISRFFTSECEKQLRLVLSPPTRRFADERAAEQMPPEQPPRPGLEQITQAGDTWAEQKVAELEDVFGVDALLGRRGKAPLGVTPRQVRFDADRLASWISAATAGRFLVECDFPVGSTFQAAMGIDGYTGRFGLEYAELRPDLIEVQAPGVGGFRLTPGGEVLPLLAGDGRLQLRVIDVKLTSEPGPSYFAEVTYYSLALAGWLADCNLDGQFVVAPDAAVWPGTYQTSALLRVHNAKGSTATNAELRAALAEDLEAVPIQVFVSRLRHFFAVELPRVLATPWRDLPWHVSSKCRGCEYLGQTWPGRAATADPGHCIPTAATTQHLSRIAFISRGASTVLRDAGVTSVTQVASMGPADQTFDRHHGLRAQRVVVAGRAQALANGLAAIPPRAGTSASLPKWADLRIYLTADFDATSAITLAFGVKAFWSQSRPFGAPRSGNRKVHPPSVRVVAAKNLQSEQKELLDFLNDLDSIIREAQRNDPQARVQIYLWDSLTYDHLTRVIGRHLPAILSNNSLRRLAWLFPPDQLVASAAAVREPLITIVRDAVRSLLALPVAHHYSLLATARAYHDPAVVQPPWNQFKVPSLFEDPLSDQIPSERAHAIWNTVGGRYSWAQQTADLLRTVKVRLDALEAVTRRLQSDLRGALVRQAPRVTSIDTPRLLNRVAADGQLWYAHAKLNAAIAAQQVAQLRAMPPHEREARFASARGLHRLQGDDEQRALAKLQLQPTPDRWVYELRPGSKEVKCNPGEFLWAISPERDPGFLNKTVGALIQDDATLEFRWRHERFTPVEKVFGVTITALDRDGGLLVVDGDQFKAPLRADLLATGRVDLDSNVIIDPVAGDYFTRKLKDTLEVIGNPPRALATPLVTTAVGQLGRGARPSGPIPAEDLLWDVGAIATAPVGRGLAAARTAVQVAGCGLNPSQWRAWQTALTQRVTLIWGPPGTGKSRTLEAIILGAAVEAHTTGRPVRVLLTSTSYTAIDNVLEQLVLLTPKVAPGATLRRLRSDANVPPAWATGPIDLNIRGDRAGAAELHRRLTKAGGVTVVAGVPMQVYNLMKDTTTSPVADLFDLIVVDEASQVDVANAVLALAGAAPTASIIVAGDPLQLPAIHATEPPLGLEALVGPVFNFYQQHHGLTPERLEENYRSNQAIIDLTHTAGYATSLTAKSPKLRLHLSQSLPTGPTPPVGWPPFLYWTEEWSALADPVLPATCFVYPEGTSGQWNAFEADAVAAIAWLLAGQMADRLDGEFDPQTGMFLPAGTSLYTPTDYWRRGLGIVTPHRAQQSKIVQRLCQVFRSQDVASQQIRGAVDTVERFQGQQRDVIIASYAVGDPDTIGDEVQFLHSLNRFNVLATRARAKLIVLVSQELVHYMAGDIAVLRDSRLLKSFAETFCDRRRSMQLGVIDEGITRTINGSFRWRS
jgi:DNA replication ATP-dependent helicase Dna2